jgi:hypothetical protein
VDFVLAIEDKLELVGNQLKLFDWSTSATNI